MTLDNKTAVGDIEQIQHENSANAKRTILVDGSDGLLAADVIATNGQNGLVAIAPGHVSTDNSTSVVLGADATYTGTYEDVTNFGVIIVTVNASHASATDGLCIDFSSDGTNVDGTDVFTIPASTGKTFSFQTQTKFYRIRYINGSTLQTHFRLQVTLKPYYVKPSSHRIGDSIVAEDDAELVKAVLTGLAPAGDFRNVLVTNGGNQKISVEEYDDAANPVRKDMEGGGKVSVGTTAVEATFTGTPTHAIIIRADRNNTGLLFVGESNVASDGSNSLTYLEAGDSVTIDYDDVDNAVYVVATVASQNFYKGALL